MTTVSRVRDDDAICPAILSLLQASFAEMHGRIDPPSSLHRLTHEAVIEHMTTEVLAAITVDNAPIACLFLTRHPDHLYLGKLAVAPQMRGRGHARRLLDWAETYAQRTGIGRLELDCRVELTENHVVFQRAGFLRVGASAHQGFDRPTSYRFAKQVAPNVNTPATSIF